MASPIEVARTFTNMDMKYACKSLGLLPPNPLEVIPEVYEDYTDTDMLQQTGLAEVMPANNPEAECARP